MLFPRCIHRRLCCVLLHEFHTTRPYLGISTNPIQTDPFATHVIIDPKPSPPRRLPSKRDSRKTRKKRQEISVGGAEVLGPSLSTVLRGKLSSSSAPTEREAHLVASENADGIIHPRATGDHFLEDVLPPSPQSPVATLAHGLERVLFQPGVHWLQDPRTKVYNFTTWLQQIIPVENFAFERVRSFVPSSRDEDLYAIAKREGRKYAGSTSSLSGLLSQLYYLISGEKLVNTADLSQCFRDEPRTFAPGQRGAASVILNYRNGVYLIDNAEGVPGLSKKNILTWMGTLLEKFLTQSPGDFVHLTRSVHNSTVVGTEPRREAYRYAKSGKIALRSQLDCFDSRLPGTGMFDIKTRAVTAIRHDLLNFEENSGYQIRTLQGLIESYEKEYYDLIRSAFLKYSFQARIGNMDGVFVAYHNTERIFGFQYIPLSEMDTRLLGARASGKAVFEKCLQLLEVVLEEATRELPCQSIRLTAEKRKREDKLKVFLEPAEWDELQGSRPVIQLDVSIKHRFGESIVNGPIAVEQSSLPWTVLWSVSKSTPDPDVVRKNVASTRKRAAAYPLFLPRGVTLREMEKFWHELQFDPVAPVRVPFKAELFRSPPKNVILLRLLARKGRWRLEHSMHVQKGRPKLVLGIPDDAKNVAPLLALAHGSGLVQTVSGSNLDDTTTTKLSTKLRRISTKIKRLRRKDRPVRSSSWRSAGASKDQDQSTRKAKNPQTIGPIGNTSTTRFSTRLWLRDKGRPVRSSSWQSAGVSKDQDQTTRKVKNSETIVPTSSYPSQTTVQTTHVHAAFKAEHSLGTNTADSGDFIAETKSPHTEEM